jgi:hypothetical protein
MRRTVGEWLGELDGLRIAFLVIGGMLLLFIVSGCSESRNTVADQADLSSGETQPPCPESVEPPGGLAGSGCYWHECADGCCQWVQEADGAVCYDPNCTDVPGVCSSTGGSIQCVMSLDGESEPVSTVDEALEIESLILQEDHPCSVAQCTISGPKLNSKCGDGDFGIPTPDGCFCPREFQVSLGTAQQTQSETLLAGDQALVALIEKDDGGKGRLRVRLFDTITTGMLAELAAPAGPGSDHTEFAWVPTGVGSDGDPGYLMAYTDNGVVYRWSVSWNASSAHLRTAAMPVEPLPGVSNALQVELAQTDSGTVAALRCPGDTPGDACARIVNLDVGLQSPPVCHEGMMGLTLVPDGNQVRLVLLMSDGSAIVETFYDTLVPAAIPVSLDIHCNPERPVAAAAFGGTFYATCRTPESTVVVEAFQPEVPGMKASVDLGPGFDPTLRPLPSGQDDASAGLVVMFGTTTAAGHSLRVVRLKGNLTVDYMADPLPGIGSTRAAPRLDFLYELAEPDLAAGGTYLRQPSGQAWYFARGVDKADSQILPSVCEEKECGPDGFGGTCGECGEDSECQDGLCIAETPPPCVPECGPKECGDDGCGGTCGDCGAGFLCQLDQCEEIPPVCIPGCGDKECGDDGCGGVCGECGEGTTCQDAMCVPVGPDCVPDCEGKECGGDECGGTCGDCGAGFLCQLDQCEEIPPVCIPSCGDKECGADGCQGTCGSCVVGYSCNDAGLCTCDKQCSGKQCGPDGCGGTCGSCQDGYKCSKGLCQEVCEPDCWGKICGDDGCGDSCGSCQYGYTCTPNGKCQCQSQCTGKQCGSDGCGGTCGSCSYGYSCTASGKCQCQSQCSGKQCGPDGCGDVCGYCSNGYSCSGAGACVCNKQCAGKACGPDGCGGTCGTCGSGYSCDASGQCAPDCVDAGEKLCISGDLFSVDSCGDVIELEETCQFGCCDDGACQGECIPYKTKSCATADGCAGERQCNPFCAWGTCISTAPPNACGGCSDLADEPDTACGASVPFISEHGCWECKGTDAVECAYPDCAYCATACAAVKVTGCGIGAGAPCALAGLTGVGALLCPVIVGAICDGMMGVVGACDSTCAVVGWCPPDGSCKE